MVLIVGHAFVNLRLSQFGKATNHIIHAGPVDDETDDIMHTNSSSFDDRASSTNILNANQLTISCSNHVVKTKSKELSVYGFRFFQYSGWR